MRLPQLEIFWKNTYNRDNVQKLPKKKHSTSRCGCHNSRFWKKNTKAPRRGRGTCGSEHGFTTSQCTWHLAHSCFPSSYTFFFHSPFQANYNEIVKNIFSKKSQNLGCRNSNLSKIEFAEDKDKTFVWSTNKNSTCGCRNSNSGKKTFVNNDDHELSETLQDYLSWSERGTVCPDVATSIPAKSPRISRTQIDIGTNKVSINTTNLFLANSPHSSLLYPSSFPFFPQVTEGSGLYPPPPTGGGRTPLQDKPVTQETLRSGVFLRFNHHFPLLVAVI